MINEIKNYIAENYSSKGVVIKDTTIRPPSKKYTEDGNAHNASPTFYDVVFEYEGRVFPNSFLEGQDIDTEFKQLLKNWNIEIPD
jgi:hypothetical protein